MSNHRDLGTTQVFSFGASFGRDRNVTRRSLAESYFKEAQTRLELGDWAGAKEWMDRARKADPSVPVILQQSDRLNGAWHVMGLSSRRKTAASEVQSFIGTGEPARLVKEGLKSFVEGADADASALLRQAMAYRQADHKLADLTAYVEKTGKIQPDQEPGMAPDEIVTLKLKKVETYFDTGKYNDALVVCQELVRITGTASRQDPARIDLLRHGGFREGAQGI